MKKSNGKLVVFFITLFLLAVVYDGNVIYGSENETVTRKYTFISNYKRDTGKGFDNNITENGEEYRLEEVTQKVINTKALKKRRKKLLQKQVMVYLKIKSIYQKKRLLRIILPIN